MLLLKSKTSLKLKDIGTEFAISERATRYDLDAIDNFLLKYNFSVLQRKTNVGVSYSVVGEDRKRLLSAVLDEREGTVYDTPASRLMGILCNLILSTKHIFIDGEADRLLVSRSTVFKDFEKLRLLFNKEKDVLLSSVAGYILEGEEKELRLDCAKVVLSIIEARDIVEIITYSSDDDSLLVGNKMYKLFAGVDEIALRKSLVRIVEHQNGKVKDNTFAFCALALSIAVKREELGFKAVACGEIPTNFEYSEEIKQIAVPLFGETESGYSFVTHLLKYLDEVETSVGDQNSFPDIQLVAYNMIKKVSKLSDGVYLLGRLLGVVSEELIDLIFDDLRGKDKLPPSLEIPDESKLYQVLKEELAILEGVIKRKINDTDIGRFFRIFSSEYQLSEKSPERKNVIVLCPFDKTYSNLVAEKIRSMFDVNVFESSGLKSLEKDVNQQNAHVIVSTLPISMEKVESVKIGTNLGEEELVKLKSVLPNRVVNSSVLKNIHQILQKHSIGEEQIFDILRDISVELNIHADLPKPKLDKRGNIASVEFACVDNYLQALEKAGDMLEKAGLVSSEYKSEMIEEVEQSKTHMVVMDGIVLAHSRKAEHVKKVGGVLLRLQEKVPFTGAGDEKCDLIFAISTLGVDSHFELIGEISEVLSSEESLSIVKNSDSEEEILNLFSENNRKAKR